MTNCWSYPRWKLITASLSITMPEVVLRDTCLAKIRTCKTQQADIVELAKMRADAERRNLKWLTTSIDRLPARKRMDWARQLQRKSLTSGAIDADSTPRQPGGGKGGGKSKGKGKGKGKGMGKREQSRDSYNTPKPKGICHMYVGHGKCAK